MQRSLEWLLSGIIERRLMADCTRWHFRSEWPDSRALQPLSSGIMTTTIERPVSGSSTRSTGALEKNPHCLFMAGCRSIGRSGQRPLTLHCRHRSSKPRQVIPTRVSPRDFPENLRYLALLNDESVSAAGRPERLFGKTRAMLTRVFALLHGWVNQVASR